MPKAPPYPDPSASYSDDGRRLRTQNEIALAPTTDPEQGLALARSPGGRFERGNRAAAGRRPTLSQLGVKLEAADPRWRAALRNANRLRKCRVRELATKYGGVVGAGPCSMLGSAARALAASTVMYELAMAAMAAGRSKEAAELASISIRFADSAKQQELTAIAIAEREAKDRRAAQGPVDPLAKWLET